MHNIILQSEGLTRYTKQLTPSRLLNFMPQTTKNDQSPDAVDDQKLQDHLNEVIRENATKQDHSDIQEKEHGKILGPERPSFKQ
jgi:hypothetical protein